MITDCPEERYELQEFPCGMKTIVVWRDAQNALNYELRSVSGMLLACGFSVGELSVEDAVARMRRIANGALRN
jgi:phosphoribosylformylglycinamidine (FGAM) synthase-like amidotransferase family enzyme